MNFICPSCSSTIGKHIFSSAERLHGREKNTHNIVRCSSCELVSLSPLSKKEDYKIHYPANYISHRPALNVATPLSLRKETCVHRVRSFVWSSWVMEQWGWPSRVLGHSLSVFRWFRARPIGFFGKERTLLDIGCGAGVFLRQQAQLGWSVFGLEPSYDMVESCRKKGLDVRQGFSISQGWTEKKFDVISLNQVFEHVDNPREVLMDVYESLQLGGVLVMNLPNWRSGAAQIFRSYWYNLDTPRHNLLVTPGTLRAMVVESGFQIKGMYTLSSMKGWTGSIEYWLRDFLGIHVSEGAISGSKFLNLLLKPMVKVLDLLYLGDNLHVIAKKK